MFLLLISEIVDFAEQFPVILIEGIYSTVADVYQGLLVLIEGVSGISKYFSGAIDALYTLIGVFMLFRIGISLITMLVDPDKINDKQEGAGKILSRIVIAVVLVLTLNSFIFPKLSQIEGLVIDQIGGFAQSLFQTCTCPIRDTLGIKTKGELKGGKCYYDGTVDESIKPQCNKINTSHNINGSFIMNVDAVTVNENHNSLFCLYQEVEYEQAPLSAEEAAILPKNIVKDSNGNPILYGVMFRPYDKYPAFGENFMKQVISSKSDKLDYVVGFQSGEFWLFNDSKKNYDHVVLSGVIKNNNGTQLSNGFYVTNYSVGLYDTISNILSNGECPPIVLEVDSSSIFLGYDNVMSGKTYEGEKVDYSKVYASNPQSSTNTEINEGHELENPSGLYNNQSGYNQNSSCKSGDEKCEQSLKFARSLASAFVSPVQEGEQSTIDTWFDYENGEFLATKPATGLREAYVDNRISVDSIMAIIMAIAAIVFLVILMIDIVVRGLKIVILQVISPIAVLSYINPKDKIFNQWVKMYGSTYADLFMKLLAISLIPHLLEAVLGTSNSPFDGHPFLRIIYILGVFLFAKGLPELISNVFGIKAAGGTFKDAAGLAKKGLGIGAGVAAGAIGASSILAHGGSLGSAANTIKAGFGGAKNVKSAKAEGIKQAYARRDSGQGWLNAEKNALKSHVPFMRTDQEKAERRIAELNGQQSNFTEADGLLEKDKSVMDATDTLTKFRTDGTISDGITNYNQLDKNMYAKLKGYTKEGNDWVQKDDKGVVINKTTDASFASQIASDTAQISNTDQIARMKENISIAKTNALNDPSSTVGQRAKEVLKRNGGDGTDYNAYDKANKAAANEISNLKHDNFIS